MEIPLDEAFCQIVRDIAYDLKNYPREDRKTVAGWLQQAGNEVQTDADRRARNEYSRHLRYIVQSGGELPEELRPVCAQDSNISTRKPSVFKYCTFIGERLTSTCPRKDIVAQLAPGTDMREIANICEDARNGDIASAAELVYALRPFVADHGTVFRQVLDRDLSFFRQIVDDTIDRRVQDEADVMMHTQNDIKQKFCSLTDAMIHRSMKIRQRLMEIAPKFDWARHGKNKAKLARLVRVEQKRVKVTPGDPNRLDRLLHQVFMRGQWIKKELARLQDENANLEMFLGKFRVLAAERKAQESHVPRMLCKEKKALEEELEYLRTEYAKNLEIVDALYIEHHRCAKPASQTAISDWCAE